MVIWDRLRDESWIARRFGRDSFLCELFRPSIVTVMEALLVLEEQGLVCREFGFDDNGALNCYYREYPLR
jgi:hypothetical protein